MGRTCRCCANPGAPATSPKSSPISRGEARKPRNDEGPFARNGPSRERCSESAVRLLRRGALLGVVADLVETLGDTLVEDVERLGIGLRDELGEFAGVGEALLERALHHLGLLRKLLLRG